MRMRKKKYRNERIENCAEYLYTGPNDIKGGELRLEIGCGKGKFIVENAKKRPDINFIAAEKISDVILIAMERAKSENAANIKFLICDAKNLMEYLAPGSVDLIYLNFGDPWPKKGHYKRRLTYKDFLDIYKTLLKPGGAIFLKTDNRRYFDFSLGQFQENGFDVKNVTYDLHSSEWEKDNVHTEYETLFSEKGFPICRCEAYLT